MKRFLFFLFAALSYGIVSAQGIFTVVYATSSDDFVNVRAQPSSKARVLTKLYSSHHGHGDGVFLGQKGNWTKVSVGKITGWAYSKYVGHQTWYTGNGTRRLIAVAEYTPIYGEDYADVGERPVFTTLKRGTIIADEFQEDDNYYILTTAHDYLFIRKTDARVEDVE